MTKQEYRLECLKMALKVLEKTGEYIEPFNRAEQFFQFIVKEEPKKKPGPKKKR